LVKDDRVHNIYASAKQWDIIFQVKRKTGKSLSSLLINGFNYWLANNPKELRRFSREFKKTKLGREARRLERETGDYLGAFDKMEEKIKRINRAYKRNFIDKNRRDYLISLTKRNYKTTAEITEGRLDKLPKKKRLKRKRKEKPKERGEKEENAVVNIYRRMLNSRGAKYTKDQLKHDDPKHWKSMWRKVKRV